MLRNIFGGKGGGTATATTETIPIEQLRQKISGKGVNKDFLAYLEQYYDLNEVWNWLQKGDAQQLAQTTGYTGEVKPQRSGGGEKREEGAKDNGHQTAPAKTDERQNKGQAKAQQSTKAEPEYVRGPKETWGARLFAEAFLTTIALGLWVVNGIATVYAVMAGCTALFGDGFGTLLGLVFGPLIHYGITRVELYLWSKWRIKEYLLALVLCSGFDVGSTLFSVASFFKARVDSLADLPLNVLTWPKEIFWPIITWGFEQAKANRRAPDFDPSQLPPLEVPSWWFPALLMIVLAVGIAIVSERLLRRYWRGLVHTWRERYATR